VLISELLDDYKEAGKEKDVADLRRRMEDVSTAEKATAKEVNQLRADLDHEALVHPNREEELKQLRGKLEKKGSKMLKRDSELQQKELILQTAQRELEEMRQRVEGSRPP